MNFSTFLTPIFAIAVMPLWAVIALADTPISIDAVRRGLDQAISQNIITQDGVLTTGVKRFLKLLVDGATPLEAAKETGIKLAVIERLQQLGTVPLPQSIARQKEPSHPVVALPTPLPTTVVQRLTTPEVSIAKPLPIQQPEIPLPPQSPVMLPQPMVQATIPIPSPHPQPVLSPRRDNPHAIANALVRGLAQANASGEIGYSAPLSFRIQNVVRRLRRGNSLAYSSQGVSPLTIERLLQLGNYQPQS